MEENFAISDLLLYSAWGAILIAALIKIGMP
jgi:hypothetical protein